MGTIVSTDNVIVESTQLNDVLRNIVVVSTCCSCRSIIWWWCYSSFEFRDQHPKRRDSALTGGREIVFIRMVVGVPRMVIGVTIRLMFLTCFQQLQQYFFRRQLPLLLLLMLLFLLMLSLLLLMCLFLARGGGRRRRRPYLLLLLLSFATAAIPVAVAVPRLGCTRRWRRCC